MEELENMSMAEIDIELNNIKQLIKNETDRALKAEKELKLLIEKNKLKARAF